MPEWHLVKPNRVCRGLNRVRIFGTFPSRDARDRASRDGCTRHVRVARPNGQPAAVQIGYPADLSRRVPEIFTLFRPVSKLN